MRHPKDYDIKVKGITKPFRTPLSSITDFVCFVDYVTRFATREIAFGTEGKAVDEEKEDEEMSDLGSFSDADDE